MLGTLAAFIVVFLITQVIFGTALSAFLIRVMAPIGLPAWTMMVLGVGLAPALVALILHYLLWAWPGVPHSVAVLMVVVSFAGIAWRAGTGWNSLRATARGTSRWREDRSMILFILCSLAFAVLTIVELLRFGLTEHDILEYGVQGGIFLRDMAIHYGPHRYDAASGFYYVGLHGFTFPLLFTWEGLLNPEAAQMNSPWVRALTPFHAWLLVTLLWGIIRSVDRWLAVCFALALGGAMGFYFLGTVYHLDSLRIFLFTSSAALFVIVIQRPHPRAILLLAAVCGASASIHSLGAIMAVLMGGLLPFLMPGGWRERLLGTLRYVGVTLLAGGIHYPVDVLWGTGWIFKDIIWY